MLAPALSSHWAPTISYTSLQETSHLKYDNSDYNIMTLQYNQHISHDADAAVYILTNSNFWSSNDLTWSCEHFEKNYKYLK